jgi:hypothetical protein
MLPRRSGKGPTVATTEPTDGGDAALAERKVSAGSPVTKAQAVPVDPHSPRMSPPSTFKSAVKVLSTFGVSACTALAATTR